MGAETWQTFRDEVRRDADHLRAVSHTLSFDAGVIIERDRLREEIADLNAPKPVAVLPKSHFVRSLEAVLLLQSAIDKIGARVAWKLALAEARDPGDGSIDLTEAERAEDERRQREADRLHAKAIELMTCSPSPLQLPRSRNCDRCS